MSSPSKGAGRMLRVDQARSKELASLSPASAVLWYAILPHLDSHGKMNAEPFTIKGQCVPHVEYLDVGRVSACLQEISAKTSLKWFPFGDLRYLHMLDFPKYQDIRRAGADHLPNFPGMLEDPHTAPGLLPDQSRTTPGVLQPEDEDELEAEAEAESEGEGESRRLVGK